MANSDSFGRHVVPFVNVLRKISRGVTRQRLIQFSSSAVSAIKLQAWNTDPVAASLIVAHGSNVKPDSSEIGARGGD